jgi:uncharacterized protein
LTLSIDLAGADAAAIVAAALTEAGGHCDVLVNCAGIGIAGDFLSQPADALQQLLDVNVRALTSLTRYFLSDMIVRKRGGVLNVASLGGYAPGPYQAVYYASKAYVLSLTEALAHEYQGQGVHIAVVAPGPVRTSFHRRMGGETGFYLRLLSVASADRVARSAYWRFRFGQRVIVPGLLNSLMMLGMRLLPHRLLVPMIGFLLKPRGGVRR